MTIHYYFSFDNAIRIITHHFIVEVALVGENLKD